MIRQKILGFYHLQICECSDSDLAGKMARLEFQSRLLTKGCSSVASLSHSDPPLEILRMYGNSTFL